MVGFKRILFPVEFSPHCQMAAPHVAAYARLFDAEVVLFHVEETGIEPFAWPLQTEYLRERLDDFLVQEFDGLKIHRLVRLGDPAHEIVSYANNEKADLIMMPTHGRGAFRRFVLGSVTTKVLHDASCPVWTSAHLDAERRLAPTNLSSVLCAVDLDDCGVHTLRYAGNFTRHVGATLTIAHAVPAVDTIPKLYTDLDVRADLMAAARERIAEMQTLAGTSATSCVGAGNVGAFVSHAAQSHKSGLVIIGRGGHGLLGRLRTHDYAIIRESQCPVLSI